MKTKVLMVCLGNICRSPLAEGILLSKIDSTIVQVDSAGTGGYHIGEPPDPRSVAIAKQNGIDISQQRCRKFSISDFDAFDVIYVMDHSNYNNVVRLANTSAHKAKVKLILEELDSGPSEVPDPYYGGDEGFEKVFHLLDNACDIIAKKLYE